MRLGSAVLTLAIARTVVAEPPADASQVQQFVGFALAIGGSNNGEAGGPPEFGTVNAGFALELGQRMSSLLFLHEQLTVGAAGQIEGPGGEFVLARVGVETRLCGHERCGIFGLDVGYEHEAIGDASLETARLVPRVGLDVGGAAIRFRPTIDFSLGIPGAFVPNAGTGTVLVNLAIAWQGT